MADREEDSLFDDVSAMADRIGLRGRDKEKYIHEHMTRGGYRAVPSYVRDDEDDEGDEGSGFFGSGRRRGSRDDRDRDDDDRRPRPRRGSRDSDSWYG